MLHAIHYLKQIHHLPISYLHVFFLILQEAGGVNKHGQSALHIAAANGHVTCIAVRVTLTI